MSSLLGHRAGKQAGSLSLGHRAWRQGFELVTGTQGREAVLWLTAAWHMECYFLLEASSAKPLR